MSYNVTTRTIEHDLNRPPNETDGRKALFALATVPEDGAIPAGTLFVEKWSNGHYGPPETERVELLSTDNIGPDFTCERRVLAPAQENPRPLTADDYQRGEMAALAAFVGPDLSIPINVLVRAIVTEVLTPPPPRPEGAEAAQQYLDGFLSSTDSVEDIDTAWLADHLIETLNDSGVRVTRAES